MGLAADTAELLVLGFVLPSAEVDFCISQTEKRVLGQYGGFKIPQNSILFLVAKRKGEFIVIDTVDVWKRSLQQKPQ